MLSVKLVCLLISTLLLQGSRAHTGSKVDVEDGNGATRVGDPSYETRK